MGDDQKLQLVHRDGFAYFVPAQSAAKVNGVRRWEQAFRIYTAIYSQANPSRAAEIWQYVHTINIAASTYTWDNVYYYDVTFRQMMAQNPHRSWAKTYTQMWHLAMREHLPRNGGNFRSFSSVSFNGGKSPAAGSGSNGKNFKKKPKYCWGHNRVGGCKDGAKCKFIHRCSYCDSGDHAKHACPKNT